MRLINGRVKMLLRPYLEKGRALVFRWISMDKQGKFCFLKEQYFIDFPDDKLMRNKGTVNGEKHNRPCFFAFRDNLFPIYWLIPISSKFDKYYSIYCKKVSRYGQCNTIRFGTVLGQRSVFLIQNMCPVTENYIEEFYIDPISKKYVAVDKRTEKDIIHNAKKVLQLYRQGKPIIFPDANKIYNSLIKKEISKDPKPDLSKEHTPWNDYLIQLHHDKEKSKDFTNDKEEER